MLKGLRSRVLFFLGVFYSILFAGESIEQGDSFDRAIDQLYEQLDLTGKLDPSVFTLSMVGYYNMKGSGLLQVDSILTIIDYEKPSSEPRFFVVNLQEKTLLFITYVAHGKGSGIQFAESFSNKPGSLKSSQGFFVTADSYIGRHGYSLKLQGMEAGINDNAMQRAIVIHGANYVSEAFAREYGRLGRSWGCPALPEDLNRQVIDTIKGGSCLFVYYPDENYLQGSAFLDRETAGNFYFGINPLMLNKPNLPLRMFRENRFLPEASLHRLLPP